jgi:lysozyme
MKKTYWWLLGIFALFMLAMTILIYKALFVPVGIEIDKNRFPVTGIDVSNHTGKIDFDLIKAQGVDFVYIKATEGGNFVDKSFERNFRNAKKANIPVGVYHFFKFNKSGKEQASNFLKHIEGKRFDLSLVLDVEEWGNPSNTNRKDVIREIGNFIDEVERKTQKKVMIYTNESGYRTYIKDNFYKKSIWICSFSKNPKIDAKWILWQYSHIGKLKGAEGWIDFNTFNGSRAEWNMYLASPL